MSALFSVSKKEVQNSHMRKTRKKKPQKRGQQKKEAKHCRKAYDTLHKNPMLSLSFSDYYEMS